MKGYIRKIYITNHDNSRRSVNLIPELQDVKIDIEEYRAKIKSKYNAKKVSFNYDNVRRYIKIELNT